jgi:hypothetical protein
VWTRFTVGKKDQLWYYGSLSALYKKRSAKIAQGEELAPIAAELVKVVAKMRSLAEK